MNRIRLSLLAAKKDFLEDLKPKYIMPWLLVHKIVTEQESKDILSQTSSQEQVEKLFEILPTKKSVDFENFIKVLNIKDECGVNYPWLAEKLTQTNFNMFKGESTYDLQENVYKLLTDGGVPFQTNCLLHREDMIRKIREELIQASNKRHWVVLHGMSGTGKSVLAAEAVRDNELIDKYFYDGVFWVALGNSIDSNALEMKMKRLYQKISESRKVSYSDKNISAIENMNDLNHNLKNIVTRKMLVILDDLWDFPYNNLQVVKNFDLGCPILVTTKFLGVFEDYSQFSSKIECTNNLLTDESKKLLSLYVNCESHELPPVVDEICDKCKGSPFTLSHIGRWMAPFGNDSSRWEYLKTRLELGLRSAIRRRHSSNDDLNEIKEIIRLTLQPIVEYKEYFLDFVIFPEDVWVHTEVFKVLWDRNIFDVEETMYCLLRNSLVQYERDPVYSFSFGIHDLYLEILKEICTDETERHRRLVNNYLKLCKQEDGSYDFSYLPDDDYIHYYLAHHMSQINDGIVDGITLDDIYFDLNFIQKKLQLIPRDLLWDYQHYKYLFENKEELEEYISFATKHMYVFNNKDCDIIQLGLFEPTNSVIYKKAFAMALKSDKSYFQWCNQEENQSHLQNLNLKLIPFENTRHATISSDGALVACVGNENKAWIYSSSGEELLILSGHTNSINYCVFNNSRENLVTASDDKTVRIFYVNIVYTSDKKPAKKRGSFPSVNNEIAKTPDMAVVTFAQHSSSVLCCSYSNDENLIVSSDLNGVAHVWQSSTAHPKCRVQHLPKNLNFHPVNVCCFNFDDTLFGTAAYDSIKLWCTSNGKLYKEFFHDEMVLKGFCFMRDDFLISVANNDIYEHNINTGLMEKMVCSRNLIITCCCLSPDENYFACGTSENTVIVFNINSGKLINNLKGHRNDILAVKYTENSNILLSVSIDGYILYDMTQVRDTSLVSFEGNLSVRQNLDDLIIVSSNYFDCIEVRKGITGRLHCKTNPDDSEITACSLSNDCSEVVYGTKNGNVKVLNIESNFLDESLPKHFSQINYITYFKNNLFFTCSEDKTLRIWDDRTHPKILKGHQQSVLMCVPFKMSCKLLSCSKDGTLRVWDTNSGKNDLITEGHGNQDVRCCDISYDEKLLASASADGTVKLWSAENGDLLKTLDCNSEVRSCRFSPSFQVLVSGCDVGEVQLWTLGSKPVCAVLGQHSSCVFNIYFNQDGSQFLSIADDIKIWKTGQNVPQTLFLPSSSMGVSRPCIWASDNFDTFVVILNTVLYVLKKIVKNLK